MSTHHQSPSPPIFILCDKCYWCVTFLDKSRIPIDNMCPRNNDTNELTSFPIMANKSFTFDYNNKYGVELESRQRCKDNSSDLYKDLTGAMQEKTQTERFSNFQTADNKRRGV
ncbi:MAG: hypothetical protein JO327_11310 [Nitrososphaeraceae archaeon]|nr:hypothetical protein [Nitrososphaeraceae archaeon]MBV9668702.1 hypothetical protein [Nitrososphaeraceae archaeon]